MNSGNLLPNIDLTIYPNPFKDVAKLHFRLAEESRVTIDIFSTQGQKIKQLISTDLDGGEYDLIWDGSNSAGARQMPGVYLVRMQTDQSALVKMVTYMK